MHSDPPGQMTQLCELINKSGELLAKNLSHLDTVLGALDIQEHSLGVLAVLYVANTTHIPLKSDQNPPFNSSRSFLLSCFSSHLIGL